MASAVCPGPRVGRGQPAPPGSICLRPRVLVARVSVSSCLYLAAWPPETLPGPRSGEMHRVGGGGVVSEAQGSLQGRCWQRDLYQQTDRWAGGGHWLAEGWEGSRLHRR